MEQGNRKQPSSSPGLALNTEQWKSSSPLGEFQICGMLTITYHKVTIATTKPNSFQMLTKFTPISFSEWSILILGICLSFCVLSYTMCSVCMLSHVRLFATPWIIARRIPLSVGFSRQEYWSRLPSPPPEDLPDSGIEPASSVSSSLAGGFFTTEPPENTLHTISGTYSLKNTRLSKRKEEPYENIK